MFLGSASTNNPNEEIKFNFNHGSKLEIKEISASIIQFNSLHVKSCQNCERCLTKDLKSCIFPFIYGGSTYNTCIGGGSSSWCATEVDENGYKTKYGYCNEFCPKQY